MNQIGERIKSIELEDFKCFSGKNHNINVDADLVLLTGKNGVGKTSLLQAIALYLNGYDECVFDKLDLCNRFSKNNRSRIFLSGLELRDNLLSTCSDKEWQQWRSPFKMQEFNLNSSVARASSTYFQDKAGELASGDFMTYLTGAGNQGREIDEWLKSSKVKWTRFAEEALPGQKNWDELRKDILMRIFEAKELFPKEHAIAQLFIDYSPLLKNGNLSSTWKDQITNLGKKLGLAKSSAYRAEFLNLFIKALEEKQVQRDEANQAGKNELGIKRNWDEILMGMLEHAGDQLLLVLPTEIESVKEKYSKMQRQLESLNKEYEETKVSEPQTSAIEQLIGNLKDNLTDIVLEVQRLSKARIPLPGEICSFIEKLQEIYLKQDCDLSETYADWHNKLKEALADKSQEIQNLSKQIEKTRQSIELSEHMLKNDKGVRIIKDNHGETEKSKLLEAIKDALSNYSQISDVNKAKDPETLLHDIESLFRELLEIEYEYEQKQDELHKMQGVSEAKGFAKAWLNAFTKETQKSGLFLSLLNEIDLSSVISELRNLLSIFHLPDRFVSNIKLDQKGTGKNAVIVPTFDGLAFNNLSTGQKTVFALAWTIVMNNALKSKIGHSIILFDDITTSLDLNQIGPACILFRKLAYAKDKKLRRQVFVSSHHEDLTNRLIDLLIPPHGFNMKIMEFKEFSLQNGPVYDIWDVAPSSILESNRPI